MEKTIINVFVVKKGEKVIQAEGIPDGYTRVCLTEASMELHPSLRKLNQQEAKDLCGKYGDDIVVSIVEKEILL